MNEPKDTPYIIFYRRNGLKAAYTVLFGSDDNSLRIYKCIYDPKKHSFREIWAETDSANRPIVEGEPQFSIARDIAGDTNKIYIDVDGDDYFEYDMFDDIWVKTT